MQAKTRSPQIEDEEKKKKKRATMELDLVSRRPADARLCRSLRSRESCRLSKADAKLASLVYSGSPDKLHPIGRESFKYDSTLHHTMLMQLSHWSYVVNWSSSRIPSNFACRERRP